MGNRHILQSYKLGSIVEIKTGKLNSNAMVEDGDYPFFTCSREVYKTNTYSFNCECVLLAGNNAAGIYPIHYYNGEFDAYQRTYVIQSSDKAILKNRYLYYALQPKLELLKSISTGAATKFLTLSILNELVLELPSLVTQRKISAILSAYDDLIENNLRRIKILEEMAQNLYREWFVNFRFPGHKQTRFVDSSLGRIPEGWEVKKLKHVLELKYGKALKKSDRNAGNVPVFGSSGVVGYHDKPLVQGPGIVVGRKGNVGSIFWSDADFYTIDTVYYITSTMPLRFLFYELQNKNFINNDAAVPGLNRNQAYSLELIVPLNDILSKFCKMADDFEVEAIILKKKNNTLRQTRDFLLPKLISGEVNISELNINCPEEVSV